MTALLAGNVPLAGADLHRSGASKGSILGVLCNQIGISHAPDSTAVSYLGRALELEPANRVIRRELLGLGRRPPPTPLALRGPAMARRRSR